MYAKTQPEPGDTRLGIFPRADAIESRLKRKGRLRQADTIVVGINKVEVACDVADERVRLVK